MPKVEHAGITFDSPEELELFFWLEEAQAHSLIGEFCYQPPTWQLAEPVIETIDQFGKRGQKIKPKTRVILTGATYTADFHVTGAVDGLNIPEYIDVKPKFTRRNSDAKKFSIIQKWLYQRHGIVVRPIVPYELFKRTFAPSATKLTPKKKQPRKGYFDLPSAKEFADMLAAKENVHGTQ